MDTYALPATPHELEVAVTCPITRLVLITRSKAGKNGSYLPKQWVVPRLTYLAQALTSGCSQAKLVELTGLSRARVSQLSAKALERVPR